MGIASTPINMLLLGTVIIIVLALAWDTLGLNLEPILKRYRVRLLPRHFNWKALVPVLVSVVLAVMMRLPLISLYLVIVGFLITAHTMRRSDRDRERFAGSQIIQHILAFRSMYLLQPSVFLTLDTAREKVDEPLRGLIGIMVQTYNATASPERAFAEFRRRSDNVYLNQFVHILEMGEIAPTGAVVKALDGMVDRLRAHDILHRESAASLATITGQTSFMHGVAIVSVFLVSVVPMLRAPYSPIGGQILFIIILSIILGASYYIDRTIDNLSERIS